jgi:hypothetical protein
VSVMVREAIRQLDRQHVILWLAAPDGYDRRVNQHGAKWGTSAEVGPMRGQVLVGEDDERFNFARSAARWWRSATRR